MTDSTGIQTPEEAPSNVKSRRGRRIMGLIIALLLILMLASSYLLYRLVAVPATSTTTEDSGNGVTWVRSIYGMSDLPKDQLERAQAAVTAQDGTIWVVDGAHRALMQFSADGRYLASLKGNAKTVLDAPSRFAIGPDGLFYICETAGDAIVVMDRSGKDAGSFRIPKPVSVAVSEDRIVVGSVAGFAILDKKGKPIKVVGSRGKGDDQFDYVHGVAIAEDGKIYVSDSYNNRISAYTPEGKRLWIARTGKPANTAKFTEGSLITQGVKGITLKGDNAMQLPLGLTLDGAGHIVVVDMFDCTITVLDTKNGKFIGKYGEVGADDGKFFYPVSVGYDSQRDWFTVADSLNNRVQIIRLPNSASGGQAAASVRRALTGPLRACLFPLLLLILAVIVWLVVRAIRKRKAKSAAQSVVDAEPSEDSLTQSS